MLRLQGGPCALVLHGPAAIAWYAGCSSLKKEDSMSNNSDPRRHAIRRRRTVASWGEWLAVGTVHCPTTEHSTPVTECEGCPECEEISLDAVTCAPDRSSEEANVIRRKLLGTVARNTPVGAVMSADVVCVTPDLELGQATALLLERGISGAPVVDEDGHPVGVISRSDLLRERWENGEAELTRPSGAEANDTGIDRGTSHVELPRGCVGDVMMPLVFAVRESDSLATAAQLMAKSAFIACL
jgi:CBS domain-containing protein